MLFIFIIPDRIFLPPSANNGFIPFKIRGISMKKSILLFLTGGTFYSFLELIWRRRTHSSMFFAGGACLAAIDRVCYQKMKKSSLLRKCAAGCGIITVIEFFTGMVVNRGLHLKVWDYSKENMNIKGQVCLRFSLFWFILYLP